MWDFVCQLNHTCILFDFDNEVLLHFLVCLCTMFGPFTYMHGIVEEFEYQVIAEFTQKELLSARTYSHLSKFDFRITENLASYFVIKTAI